MLTPVIMILFQIAQKGLAAMSWEFLTQPMPYSLRKEGGGFAQRAHRHGDHGGLGHGLISVPLGILAAVYLAEYGKKNLLPR